MNRKIKKIVTTCFLILMIFIVNPFNFKLFLNGNIDLGPQQVQAASTLIVDFGENESSNVFGPYGSSHGWDLVITADCMSYSSDGNAGLKMGDCGTRENYFRVEGADPIDFQVGQTIRLTVHNPTDYRVSKANFRISFEDKDHPSSDDEGENDNGEYSGQWWGMYPRTWDEFNKTGPADPDVEPHTTREFLFNITSEDLVYNRPGSPDTDGERYFFNINSSTVPEQLVIDKIDLIDTDTNPPEKPENLQAEVVDGRIVLTWDETEDLGDFATGVQKYYIHRNNEHLWTIHPGVAYEGLTTLTDVSIAPGQTYTYTVTAVDNAIIGRKDSLGNIYNSGGNESLHSDSVTVTVPYGGDNTHRLSPVKDLVYQGSFKMPSDFNYSTGSIAHYPAGDSGGSSDGYPGSLYALGHDDYMYAYEVTIPEPLKSSNLNDLNLAQIIKNGTNVMSPAMNTLARTDEGKVAWPNKHGAILPLSQQEGQTSPKLYNSFASAYAGWYNPSHGSSELDFSNPRGTWWIEKDISTDKFGHPNSYDVGGYLLEIPQDWADTYAEGRILGTGRNHTRGSVGPTLYATAPWEYGDTPEENSVIDATPLLQYTGITDSEDHLPFMLAQQSGIRGASWLTTDSGKSAVAFSGSSPFGEIWYGDCNGAIVRVITLNIPNHAPPSCNTLSGKRISGVRGFHGNNPKSVIAFYDTEDLAKVAQGEMEAYEPQPYGMLTYDFKGEFGSLAYDDESEILYVFESNTQSDGSPLVHVYKLGLEGHDLLVKRTGSGQGRVVSDHMIGIFCGDDCTETYELGETITLTAEALGDESEFVRWTGACSGTELSCTITMNEAKTVTAEFKMNDSSPKPGDVDLNGSVTLTDTILILRIVSDSAQGKSGNMTGADADGDGRIGVAEAIYTLQELAK